MRSLVSLFAFGLLLFSGIHATQAGDVKELFNGQDLTNWDGDPALWSVKDGILTGVSDGKLKRNQFLIWTGGVLNNFELTLDFRLEGKNNTGVQYRSKRRPELGDWVVTGYQADIHPNPPYIGMLYEEGGRGIVAQRGQSVVLNADGSKKVESNLEKPVELNLAEWQTLKIVCDGDHIRHYVNGVQSIDVVDHHIEARSLEGVLALQLHAGPPSTAQFRNIKLVVLKPTEAPAQKTE